VNRFNKLINAFGNLDLIYEGIKNKVFTNEEVEEIARIRYGICTQCEYFDNVGTHCAVPGMQPCCSDCGCSLPLKTRSMSAGCPKNKWSPFIPKEMEETLKENLK
jgi:hypothetical protein|tara:strand:- start:1236 stop:1550 length:315 start_codon:yes stop_codon:yes gene_type:complete